MAAKKAADKRPTFAEREQQDIEIVKAHPCPRCGAAILTARAGRVAALDVRADAAPLDALSELQARLAGRLTWHLVTGTGLLGVRRFTWRTTTDIQAGPARWPVVADHHCKGNVT